MTLINHANDGFSTKYTVGQNDGNISVCFFVGRRQDNALRHLYVIHNWNHINYKIFLATEIRQDNHLGQNNYVTTILTKVVKGAEMKWCEYTFVSDFDKQNLVLIYEYSS